MDERPTTVHAAERLAARRLASAFGLPAFQPGSVWLAGAGPGDPGLVTLLGLHAIAEADVIIHDALANEALLTLARPGAERLAAGKRCGRKSPRQADISRLLVARARRGERVLRLKGGDPFVFGRGGEEALALVEAGVPFRIIPGVTAGIGGLAYAGIPATHRDMNHTVTFITGHDAGGRLPELDWDALSRGAPLLVFYMALGHAGEIAARLIAAGRAPDEPAAILGHATLDAQACEITTLAKLDEAARKAVAPALIVVGRNVLLSASLDWLGALRDGKRLLTADQARLSDAS
jgi:uroporphyrin-III C-methyltransferase